MDKIAFRKKQLASLMGFGGTFGVISAYAGGKSKKENQIRHGLLMSDLQKAGLRPIPLRGAWEGVTEKSYLIPKIPAPLLFDLGRKYNQDAVIFKSKEGVLGMYFTKGLPRAEVAVDPAGDIAFQSSEGDDLFSKSRGLSFEFGFLWGKGLPWDGKTPIRKSELSQLRLAFRVASRYLRQKV